MAAGILAEAVQQGISFRMEGGVVQMRSATPPAPALLEMLRLHREGIAALLTDHDAPEQEAMRQHYAAAPGPDLPPDPMKGGLLRGFYVHRTGGQRV